MANRSATRAPAAEPSNVPRASQLPIRALLFWPEKSDLWFKQLDIHFQPNKVTLDQTKFSFALSHIDATNANEIADLISNPPEKDLLRDAEGGDGLPPQRDAQQQDATIRARGDGRPNAVIVPQAHEDVNRYSHDVNSDRSSTSSSRPSVTSLNKRS